MGVSFIEKITDKIGTTFPSGWKILRIDRQYDGYCIKDQYYGNDYVIQLSNDDTEINIGFIATLSGVDPIIKKYGLLIDI